MHHAIGKNIKEATQLEKVLSNTDYGNILKEHAIEYIRSGIYYQAETIDTEDHELFISVMVTELPLLLALVLPYCKKNNIPLRLVCDQDTHFRLNHGEHGLRQVGKVILFYPVNKKEADGLGNWLVKKTEIFHGPDLSLYPCMGGSVFSNYKIRDTIQWRFFSFTKRHAPDILHFKSKRVIGKYYLPSVLLRFSAKGEIHKAINLRSMNWCIIKRGRHCAFEDNHGRTIRDRLRWQAFLCNKLEKEAPVQKVIRYIEDGKDTYLVMEYINGMMVGEKIKNINPDGLSFKAVDRKKQKRLLQLFLQTITSIQKLHRAGIVHRDINEGNLISVYGIGVFVIDLEMAVDLNAGLPVIPFFPGASSYRAPEQDECMPEGFGEDIYSIGCLFYLIITNHQPENFSRMDGGEVLIRLQVACDNDELVELCKQCTDEDPEKRPSLNTISNTISASILTM